MGLNAESFRKLHRRPGVGETYRWFKAVPSSAINPETNTADPAISDSRDLNSIIYVEQPVSAAWRAKVDETRRDVGVAEFGVISESVTQISVMPDETYIRKLDKVVLTQRVRSEIHTVLRDSDASGTLLDPLLWPFVVSVVRVLDAARNYVAGTDYKLTPNEDPLQPAAIEWLSGGTKPSVGHSYTVEYTRRPVYTHLDEKVRDQRPDINGVLLPLRIVLTEDKAGNR